MKSPVIIKGNRYGIVLVLKDEIPFNELLDYIKEKFVGGISFFDGKESLAITFQGRTLTNDEVEEILDVISEFSNIDIKYVIDENTTKELEHIEQPEIKEVPETIEVTLSPKEQENKISYFNNDNDGLFYKGTLRSGQTLEAEGSLVIVGDINPGATVISNGNIIVLGTLHGYAYAGALGNPDAFVLALNMSPIQIRIGDVIARSSDQPKLFKKKKNTTKVEPQIAYVDEGNIYIEPVTKSVLNDINI